MLGLADLSFVYLPGLVPSVGQGGTEKDIELVGSLVTSYLDSYLENPSCGVLLAVSCESKYPVSFQSLK